jgi:hypothetical protein
MVAFALSRVKRIAAVATNLSDVVTPLPVDFASAASLLWDRCATQLQEGTVRSLVACGRVSVPATPKGLLPSRHCQPNPTSALSPEIERQPAETAVSWQGMLTVDFSGQPHVINGSFSTHVPVALKCSWAKP